MASNLYIQLPEDFDKRYTEYRQKVLAKTPKIDAETPKVEAYISIPEIAYNKIAGIGHFGDNKFKFKDHQPEYRIFGLIYENINKKVLRYDVLVAAHFYEEGEDENPVRKTEETNTINEIVKTIRSKTGLNTEQLVNNNGNLTLIGKTTDQPQI